MPVGTTGETATLSHDEHRRVVELCVETAAGRVPVIAGAGSNSTAEAIELVRHAKAVGRRRGAGGDALLQPAEPGGALPALRGDRRRGRYPGGGLQRAHRAPASTSPTRRWRGSPKLPHIVGIKDATGDLARASLQRLMCGPDWMMLSGDDPTALGYMAHGGHGCISVTANVAPGACARLLRTPAWPATGTGARALQDRLMRLHKGLFLDASPAPTKFALAHLGLCAEERACRSRPARKR